MPEEIYREFPFRLPEANVQAEFFHQARLLGLECVLELPTPLGRLDVAFLNEAADTLICIVECKSESRSEPIEGKQIDRYKSIGVPVFTLSKRADAAELANRIMEEMAAMGNGISLDDVMAMPRFERKRGDGSRSDLYLKRRFQRP